MDGENHGKPGNPIKMDDLGGKTHYFWKHPNGVAPHILKRKRMFQTPIIQALKPCFSTGFCDEFVFLLVAT